MNLITKNGISRKRVIGHYPLTVGQLYQVKGGIDMYVIPITQFDDLEQKDLLKLKREIKARELIRKAHQLTQERINSGWTDQDFKKDFDDVLEEISQSLKVKPNGKKKK